FGKNRATVHAVTDVNLQIFQGETLGVVGESGCGKSTFGRLIIRLLDPTRGQVFFEGKDLGKMSVEELRSQRKQMQMVFQDPYASLNPRLRVRDLIAEPLITHKVNKTAKEDTDRVEDLMRKCGIRPEFMYRYPHQFSGGQRQRVSIARALALNPKLIICDEPVSALDVSIQSQILNLLGDLQQELGLTYVFISHDLSVVRYLSDRVCVMFLGKVCELGITRDIYANPLHPYTKFLLEAVPIPDPKYRKDQKDMLTGEIPSPVNPPSGCHFRTRCPYATERCAKEVPQLHEVEPGRTVACHLFDK
ncbi:MAG: ATP-binding cassette domain-containing protein, partial [Firmicutes bacterium]|nr:ATP-binding cassette domain-containing protein [Bacillota bacterium]